MDVTRRTSALSMSRRTRGPWITGLALNIFVATAYGQATPGESFNAQLEEACANTQSSICNEFRRDGGSDGPNGGVGGQNNFDTLGAQNQTIAENKEQRTMFQAPTWSVFGAVNIGNRERSDTRLENGYDGDVIGGSFGIDKTLSEKFVAGLVLGQYRFDGDFTESAGTIETETQSVAVFLSYDHSETSAVSLYAGRDRIDLETVRNIQVSSGLKQAASQTDGNQTVAGLNLYYSWPLDAWLIGADVSIDYVEARIDAFQETAALGSTEYLLSYPDQDIESLTISTAFEVAYNASYSWGVLVPRFRFAYLRETENEARNIVSALLASPDVSFTTTTDEADRDFFSTSVGASAVLADDWQLFADATTFVGNDLLDNWVVNIGIHKQF